MLILIRQTAEEGGSTPARACCVMESPFESATQSLLMVERS